VLTKTDLLDSDHERQAIAELKARIAALNPAAAVLAAADVTPQSLTGCGLFDPQQKIPDVRGWLAAEAYPSASALHATHAGHDHDRHDERIRAFTLTADTPIPSAVLEMFIDLLRSLHGPKLLRLKGLINIAKESDAPLVIHGVQHVLHPAVRLARWPDADKRTRIVLITRDLSVREVKPLFDACLNRIAPDQPDRAALLDNPLVPSGSRDR
jgi:G3E family GTPase